MGVIGPYNSYCAQVEIPILNRAPGGPVPMISPSNTYPGLTRGGPGTQASGGYRGEPGVYYPTGTRSYFRLRPGDDLQGAALAVLAKRLGLHSVFVLDDGTEFWKGLVSDPFRNAAETLGVRVGGSAVSQGVLEAGQAAELFVAAIARSDGTRASVLRELHRTRVHDGIIGSFGFDANGDITSPSIPILRITGATPPGAGLPPDFQGARLDRVVQVPRSLVE